MCFQSRVGIAAVFAALVCVFPANVHAASVDPKALQLLNAVELRELSIKTLSADAKMVMEIFPTAEQKRRSEQVQTFRVRLMRPDFARVDQGIAMRNLLTGKGVSEAHFMTYAADGTKVTQLDYQNGYFQYPDSKYQIVGAVKLIDTLHGFYDSKSSLDEGFKLAQDEGLVQELSSLGSRRWQGADYRVVRVVAQDIGTTQTISQDIYIGKEYLIHRIAASRSDGSFVYDFDMTNVVIDAPMKESSFAYSLPAKAHPAHISEDTSAPLKNGTMAPDFTAVGPGDKPLHLSDFRGKTVILDFWSTWCGNCIQEMPKIDALVKQNKAGSIVVLSLDIGDRKPVYERWIKTHGNLYTTFAFDPGGIDGAGIGDKLYAHAGLPTTYVIDPNGKITGGIDGYSSDFSSKLSQAIQAAGGGVSQ